MKAMMRKGLLAPVIGLSLLALTTTGCGTLGGAAIGAGLDEKDPGRGAKRGALIGAGVGAAAGTLYDWSR